MDAILQRRQVSEWQRFLSSPSLFLAQKLYTYTQRRRLSTETRAATVPPNRVRVVCISDTHNQHEHVSPLPDGDILVHAGDLTQSGTVDELERVLGWLNAQPHTHKFFIAGNHDTALSDPSIVARLCASYPDLTYLQDSESSIIVHGRTLVIYGSPNTPRHGSWQFQYPRIPPSQAAQTQQWSSISLNTDILVTHGPPAFHLDNGGSGCVALLHALWRVRPVLHVFGHIHAARGVERVQWTAVQRTYEKICERRGGWWGLLAILFQTLESLLGGFRRTAKPRETQLVNASVLGGFRDELRRPAIVVDI